jgi:hypothetical protein
VNASAALALVLLVSAEAWQLEGDVAWLPPKAVCWDQYQAHKAALAWCAAHGRDNADLWPYVSFWDNAYYARCRRADVAYRRKWLTQARWLLGEARWQRQEWPVFPLWQLNEPLPSLSSTVP